MSKQIMIDNLVAKGLSKKDATLAVETNLETIETEVVEKGSFNIVGFGKFEKRTRSARKGRNPQTGAEIEIAESTSCGFKSGKKFNDKF